MYPKLVDPTNKLLNHIVVGLLSLILVVVFQVFGGGIHRAVAAASFTLLFLVLIIGPIMRLWRPNLQMLPWGLPWSWRGELGIWFTLLSIIHGILEMQEKEWSVAAIDIGGFISLIVLFWALILAATSFSKAIKFLGIDQWKWLHSFAYVIFYLVVVHIIYYTWLHPTGHTGPAWLSWMYLTMIIIVVVLQFAAFIRTVVDYRHARTS
ncbi:MAG: hypothetical protein HYV47_02045 [Candidatus Nealsonbacteria bacterium]|nr:hypothetical protein [Candidatus Nealsonbacteria bacterium]